MLSRILIGVQDNSEQETIEGTDNLDGSRNNTEHKGLFGRVAARALCATLILGIGIGAYAYATGNIELTFLTSLLERVIRSAPTEPASRASLYQRSATDPNAPSAHG
jgi:hypothetical protein